MGAGDVEGEREDLLRFLGESRGLDFTGYKRSTLSRRLGRRMAALGLQTYREYRDYLEVHQEEYLLLFDSLLINVTGFFRDPPAWEALRERVMPELLTAKGAAPIRVWCAGCATGEEAYTLAIVFAEFLGVEQFRQRVTIYATDLDEGALQVARAATYSERKLREVPEHLREEYFEPGEERRTFRRDLRRSLVFGRADLARDAPISRVNLLTARNTLMYFNAETQRRIVGRFHFALADPGFLFLGKAELLLGQDDRFEPVDLRMRLFRKIGRGFSYGAPRGASRPGPSLERVRPVERLRAARGEPRAADEELEIAEEKLQTAYEELERAYEELQWANEGLETMNEELQSTNDELQAANEELRARGEELGRANLLLTSLLRSLGGAVAVLDRDLRVRLWGPGAAELWGLSSEEAEGRHLLALDIGLPVEEVAPLLRRMLAPTGRDPLSTRDSLSTAVDAVDRRGRSVRLDVTAILLRDPDDAVSGVILVMDRERRHAGAPGCGPRGSSRARG